MDETSLGSHSFMPIFPPPPPVCCKKILDPQELEWKYSSLDIIETFSFKFKVLDYFYVHET